MVDRTPNFNLELIDFNKIPWHEREHDNWRTIDAVFANFIVIGNMQGVWQNATAVTVDQKYVDAELGTIWTVEVAHTTPSTGTFAASRTADSNNWSTFTVQVTSRGTYTQDTAYSPNDFVQQGSRYGIAQTAFISDSDESTVAASYDADVTDGNIDTLIDLSAFVLPTLATDVIIIGNSAGTAWEALTGAALRSIAGLTTAANKMIYTTAPNTYAVASLTAFARTIQDDPDAGTVRATIGAGTVSSVATSGLATGGPITGTGTVTVAKGSGAEIDTGTEDAKAVTPKAVADAIGSSLQGFDVDTLYADTDDNLTAGFSTTPVNDGTKTTGTYTPDQDGGNFKFIVNGGAFTLAPPTDDGTIIIQITNNGSAGAITTSGFTIVDGDSFTTTNTEDFFAFITKNNSKSSLTVKALQ